MQFLSFAAQKKSLLRSNGESASIKSAFKRDGLRSKLWTGSARSPFGRHLVVEVY